MYRVSVTNLEKFRRMLDSVTDYDTEQALVDSLSGKFVRNDKMKLGAAFHKIIEDGYPSGKPIAVEGIIFNADQAAPAINYRNAHPGMVHEVPVSKIYHTSRTSFVVGGRADGIEGIRVRDAKTKFMHPGWGEYYNSYQWRFYLDMLMASEFYYDVFEIRGYKELKRDGSFEADIVAHEPFQCLWYQNLEQDVQNLMNEFAAFIDSRNYYHLLKKIN